MPPFPPDSPGGAGPVHLRFEDITQDGRLLLEALPAALWPAVWSTLLPQDRGVQALYRAGIVPILSRLVLEGTRGPFPAMATASAEGTFRLVRAVDGRFLLDMWSDLRATPGRTYAPHEPSGERAPVLAGRVFAEHTLTRPFAPAGARRVTTLDFDGAPEVSESRSSLPPESVATMPDGAGPLEPSRRLDPVPVTFGTMHTDSNMHVNSLVYLRVFEEAALRRFAALGRGVEVLARSVEIAYRKPCFAGQTVRVAQQAFEMDGRPGVAAVLVAEADAASSETLAAARPLAYLRMHFEP